MKKNHNALLLALLGGILVGMGPVLAKLIEAPAIAIVFYRILLALPFFLLLKSFSRSAQQNKFIFPPWKDMLLLISAGVLFALDMSAFYVALKFTSVAIATLLGNFSPVFITGYNVIFKKQIGKESLWALLALAGLLLLCNFHSGFLSASFHGAVIALISAGFFTGHIILVNKLGTRYNSRDIMLWSSVGGVMMLIILCVLFHTNLHIMTYHNFLFLLLMAWGSQVVGQTFLTSSIATFPPAFSSLSVLIDPLAAAFFAFLVLGESLNWNEKIGGIIILISIMGAYQTQPRTS